MPNFNPDTGIAFGTIYCNSLDPDFIWDAINELESPEMTEAFHDACRDRLYELFQKGELTAGDLDCEPEGEEEFIAGLTGEECADLMETMETWFTQGVYDGIDESDFRKEGEIDGIPVSVSSLGGAALLWVLGGPLVGSFRHCSPCVPGAADLDSPCDAGDPAAIQGYDVPREWRRQVDA